MDKKKILVIMIILGIGFIILGSTFAYLSWRSSEEQKTNIVFTVASDFSCAADGGGDITVNDVTLIPTIVSESTSGNYIKREVKVKPTITKAGKTIYMDLWLDINDIGIGLTNSDNFMYAFTTSSTSPTDGVVVSGNFKGKNTSDKINLLSGNEYTAMTTDTYYLWIWLDAAETSAETMNQTFNLSLNGSCMDYSPVSKPEITDSMIPVVISSDGITSTISENDAAWYNYNNKEWANMILVTDNSRNKYLNTSGVIVNEDDILAYYVWIPRYKYRIPEISCGSLINPVRGARPECYRYVISESDKSLFINWFYDLIQANIESGYTSDSYTLEDATNDINNYLNGGYFNLPANMGISIVSELLDRYNYENRINYIGYTIELSPLNKVISQREIDIVFEDKSTSKALGDAVNTYRTHPAFTFGDTELNGIWVGKFVTGGTTLEPLIKPNIIPNMFQSVSGDFTTARIFETGNYGITNKADAHLMKNSEWGALAYLTHSRYGINREIFFNNSNDCYTGRSGGNIPGSTAIKSVYPEQSSYEQVNQYVFYTWDGYLLEYDTDTKSDVHDITKVASTTGNITGVYDMSSQAGTYVMGVLADDNGRPRSGGTFTYNSGFNGIVYDDSGNNIQYTDGIDFPDSKYYDLYTSTNLFTACNGGICYGHGLSEVINWYGDSYFFVYYDMPWVMRGEEYMSTSNQGTFNFVSTDGSDGYVGFARSVLAVDTNS